MPEAGPRALDRIGRPGAVAGRSGDDFAVRDWVRGRAVACSRYSAREQQLRAEERWQLVYTVRAR